MKWMYFVLGCVIAGTAGPAHSRQTNTFDVEHIRIHLSIQPVTHIVTGELRVQVRSVETPEVHLTIPTRGIHLQRAEIIVPGRQSPSLLGIVDSTGFAELVSLPDSSRTVSISVTDNSTDSIAQSRFSRPGHVFEIILVFEIESGLVSFPLGSDAGDWTAVRSADLFKPAEWIPFSVDSSDIFSAEIRVSAPIEWTILLAGETGPLHSSAGRKTKVAYLDSTSSVANLGFAAFSGNASEIRSVTSERDSVLAEALTKSSVFFGDLGLSLEKESHFLTWQTRETVQPLAAGLYMIPDPSMIDPPAERSLALLSAEIEAARWVSEKLTSSNAETQAWHGALRAYLVGEFVREQYGSGAFTAYMWDFREQYFSLTKPGGMVSASSETAIFNAPIDPTRPSDILPVAERVMTARGVWILGMLADRIGRAHFMTGLVLLGEHSLRDDIDLEDVQTAFETAAGESLSSFFSTWVYGSGHPILDFSYSVRPSQDVVDVEMDQTQDLPDAPSWFDIDTKILVSSLSGVDSSYVQIRRREARAQIQVSLRPQFILFDPDGSILYAPARAIATEDLISGLRRATGNASRIAILRQLDDRSIEPSHVLGLRSVLSMPLSADVRASLLQLLAHAAPSNTALRDLLAASESEVPVVQAAALNALSQFPGSPEARSRALNAANSSQNPLILSAAVRTLVRVDSSIALAVLESAMVTPSENDVVRRQAIDVVLSAPLSGDKKWALIAPLIQSDIHPVTRKVAWAALTSMIGAAKSNRSLISRWASVSPALRYALVIRLSEQIPTGSLTDREKRELIQWSLTEPDAEVLSILRTYVSDIATSP